MTLDELEEYLATEKLKEGAIQYIMLNVETMIQRAYNEGIQEYTTRDIARMNGDYRKNTTSSNYINSIR